MTPFLLAVLLLQQTPARNDAATIVRDAQRAAEAGTLPRYASTWAAALTRGPHDRRALLANATAARLRYDYGSADAFYRRLLHTKPTSDEYVAAAHLGMALWRSLGTDIPGADSLYAQARAEAVAAGAAHIAFDATMSLAQLRGRTVGPRVGLQLVRDARDRLGRLAAEDSATVACAEGGLLEQLGDTSGVHRVELGIAIASRLKAPRLLAICKLRFAQLAERRGYFANAAGSAAIAAKAYEQAHDLLGVAVANQWLGYARLQRGTFAGARANLELAVQTSQRTRFPTVEAWAHGGLAELLFVLGDGEAAHVEATRAATLHAAQGDLWGLATARRFEALVLDSQRHLAEASAKDADAIAAYRRAGLASYAIEVFRHRALIEIRRGNLDTAQATLDEATRVARASGNSGWMAELPIHLARLAMARGDLRAADSLLMEPRNRHAWRKDSMNLGTLPFALFEAQFALRAQRVAAAESAVVYASAAIARWRTQFAPDGLRAGIAQLRASSGSLSEAYPPLVAGLGTAGRLNTAFSFIESVRARELTEATMRSLARMTDSAAALREFQRMSAPAALTLDDVQRRLQRDEALISLTLGGEGAPTTAIVLTSDTAFGTSLPPREVLAPLIDRYARVASAGTEPADLARQLGAALLTPVVSPLPRHVTRLMISPDGALFRVPFDALRLADGRYAVERYTISLVPSATVAMGLRTLRSPATATRLVAVGDPAFGSGRLSRLPQSANEVQRVAQYGVQSLVWTRMTASETNVRAADWATIGVAHFATHALVDGDGQARTALALAPGGAEDGYLTASEISGMRLSAPLIVLSACQTLGGQILGGEGLRGLAGPLFEAGARAIVATHWSIGDRSVLPFVDRFYAGMAGGASVGDALRDAKLAAIRDGASITDWAAFTVIGDALMNVPLKPRRLSPVQWLRDRIQPMRGLTATSRPRAVSRR